ncbi:helix-turn-helix domain-containing protein [bacterium]|nr:MAG: helix-turn-helix domain-containing protein [bacterium]
MTVDPSTIDWEKVAVNVRLGRRLQRLTRVDLAKLAKIDVSTLFRVEHGRSIRNGSLHRIANAMDIPVEWFFVDRREENPKSYFLHQAAREKWFPLGEKRAIQQGENFERLQDPDERRRLGTVGLVGAFVTPGVGSTRIEVYGKFEEPFNDETHERACLCVLQGCVVVSIEGDEISLSEGDQVNYRCETLRGVEFRPIPEGRNGPAVLLWTGTEAIERKRKQERRK